MAKSAEDVFLSDDLAQITNLRIRLYAKGSDVAMTQMPRYRFKQLVPWDLGDSIQVTLVNMGTNDLTVNSVTNAEPFEVVGDIPTVAAGESVEFTVRMKPCDVKTYCQPITLHTSAGDVEFEVEGTTDYVRYLGVYNGYSPIAPICSFYNKYYIDLHYCQSVYESSWLQGLEGAQFIDMTFFTQTFGRIDLQSTSASWNIMETADSVVTMNNVTPIPDGLTNVYEGEQIDIDRYEFTVPFNEPYEYQGGNLLYFAEQLSYEPFAYGFYWRSQAFLTDEGTDDYSCQVTGVWVDAYNWQNSNYRPIMRIRYIPAGGYPDTGIEELSVTEQQQGDGYTYDLMGRRVNPNNLTPGIYIRNGKKFAVK